MALAADSDADVDPAMRVRLAAVGMGALVLSACTSGPPPVVTPPAAGGAPRPTPLTTPRPLGVAVAVGTPTATVVLSGDYATLVRPRLERIQQSLVALDQQLDQLRTAPAQLATASWRAEAQVRVDAIGSATRELRAVGVRPGADADLSAQVLALLSELDFVVDEYHQAFDQDPDGTHLVRAGRAERATADELDAVLTQLRRGVGPAPSPARAP